uniref:Uncharacterized protein n=1 Tax=Kalanchoe fedtschenkoi TaxID=63787 RepID=A0A7N0ZW63_KALFE
MEKFLQKASDVIKWWYQDNDIVLNCYGERVNDLSYGSGIIKKDGGTFLRAFFLKVSQGSNNFYASPISIKCGLQIAAFLNLNLNRIQRESSTIECHRGKSRNPPRNPPPRLSQSTPKPSQTPLPPEKIVSLHQLNTLLLLLVNPNLSPRLRLRLLLKITHP